MVGFCGSNNLDRLIKEITNLTPNSYTFSIDRCIAMTSRMNDNKPTSRSWFKTKKYWNLFD